MKTLSQFELLHSQGGLSHSADYNQNDSALQNSVTAQSKAPSKDFQWDVHGYGAITLTGHGSNDNRKISTEISYHAAIQSSVSF